MMKKRCLRAAVGLVLGIAPSPALAAAWSAPVTLSDSGEHPSVGVSASGEAVAVYGSETGGLLAVFGSAARPFQRQQLVEAAGGFDNPASLPVLAVNRAGDAIAASTAGTDAAIVATTRPPGGRFGRLQVVSRSTAIASALALRVAISPGRRVALAWTDQDPDEVRVATAHVGGSFSRARVVSPRGASYGDVAVLRSGQVLVAWVRRGDVELRLIDTSGRLGPIRRLSRAGDASEVRVVAGRGGGALLVWRAATGTHSEIDAADVTPSASVRWRGRVSTRVPGSPFAYEPDVALGPDGGAVIAYTVHREGDLETGTRALDGQGGRLYVATRTRRGRFGRPRPLTGRGSHVLDPRVSLNASGAVLVAFNEGDPGSNLGGEEYRHALAARGTLSSGFEPPARLSGPETVDFNGSVSDAVAPSGRAIVIWSGLEPPDFRSNLVRYATG